MTPVELAELDEMGADGTLSRTEGAGPEGRRDWLEMPRVKFASKGALLLVGVESGPGGTKHEEVALASQRLMFG